MAFQYTDGTLTCEGRSLADLGQQFGTPAFIYSESVIKRNLEVLQAEFGARDFFISYALKANANPYLLRMLRKAGLGVDIVSGGELFLARNAGFEGKDISFAGVGKTTPEMEKALAANVSQFNVESAFELEQLNILAGKQKKSPEVLLRLNPDIDAQTHPKITTGLRENKFGMPAKEVFNHFQNQARYENLIFSGIHCHIGSQIQKSDPYTDLVDYLLTFIALLNDNGIQIKKIDLGGGFGVDYEHPFQDILKTSPYLGRIAKYARRKLGDYKLFIQPGRILVANTGILLTRVLGLKTNNLKTFVVVDGAMNEMLRPSLYNAYHAVEAVTPVADKIQVDIVGPVCETGDYFARDRWISKIKSGEYLALGSAGAYGYVMASTYNARPFPPEILVRRSGEAIVMRRRQTYTDLIRFDS